MTSYARHCVYCGAYARGNVCTGHRDLPRLDPLFWKVVLEEPRRHL